MCVCVNKSVGHDSVLAFPNIFNNHHLIACQQMTTIYLLHTYTCVASKQQYSIKYNCTDVSNASLYTFIFPTIASYC